MGTCSGKLHHTESKAAQTDLNPIFWYDNEEMNNGRYHNYKPMAVHSRNNNQRPNLENVQLKNSILTDWRHPGRFDFNFFKSDTNNAQNTIDGVTTVPVEIGKLKYNNIKDNGDLSPTISGVWPINGIGDSNTNNIRNSRNNFSQSRFHLNKEIEKSNLNLNISDEDETGIQKRNFFNDINNLYDSQFKQDLPQPNIKNDTIIKINRKNSALRQVCSKEPRRSKSIKKTVNHRPKSGNNNSNNYNLPFEDKQVNNPDAQKSNSSNLLDQDNYPIQYTFYVDDNDICTKPFYDRRMVAIAKTCRCRIYFHAKADELEKPLYYKGKPVRPVTITSPDMACLKRCLGSIDSQFPYFNCKAFLSLSS